MKNKDLVLKVGQAEWEGRVYTYFYVTIEINGVETEIRLKASSKLEKDLLTNIIN